ncbi:hypothetical protein AB0M44_44350, partial [Streptosporangium subroseum]|uniref:hypothetical protein n=1 Tax=Streptosporangium subroseum TaxID=106412 RepID=UPI00341271A9
AEGPDLHLLHSTASSKVSYTTTSPSALVAHLKIKLRTGSRVGTRLPMFHAGAADQAHATFTPKTA